MNKKLQRLVEPSMKMYLLILVVFAAVTFWFHKNLAMVEGIVILVLIIYSLINNRIKRKELLQYIESITYNVESAKSETLLNFPLPIVVFKLDDHEIIWGNQEFFTACVKRPPSSEIRLTDMVPKFSSRWMLEGKNQNPGLVEVEGRKYQIHGNIVRSAGGAEGDDTRDYMGITYWLDVTDYEKIKQEHEDTRPAIAIIVLDNYDELLKNMSERVRNDLRSMIEDKVTQWAEGRGGMLRRYDRDRYTFIFEARYLDEIIEHKFPLLDSIQDVVNPSGIHATVSIGIGKDGADYEENFHFASLGIEMALSRGGDQAVIRNRFNFEFFGGRGIEVETRTKVKSRVMANALSGLITESSQTFVMGHKYADMDSLGGAVGICCIARTKGVPAYIVIDEENNGCGALIQKLKGSEAYKNAFISPKEAMLMADSKSLLVVVDTNRPEQVEDQTLLMACNHVAVIDHHRRAATYIENAALTFLEPYASSVCELMTELLQELVEQSDILRCEAEAMLAGIVMDTKNFTIRTGERTFDAAAFLRRADADTTGVKKLLQTDFPSTVAKYKILQSSRMYRGSIAISAPDSPQDRIVAAQAADEMLNISGIQASIVAYPAGDGSVMISARSIGDFNVQVLLEQLGGGGNKSSAGAQLYDTGIKEAVNMLLRAIDSYYDD